MHRVPSLVAILLLLAAVRVAAAGVEQASLTVKGTEFRVQLSGGRELRSAELVGAVLSWRDGGHLHRIRIDAVEPDPRHADVMLHSLSIRDESTSQWQPLCLPDATGRRIGFPLALDQSGEKSGERFTLTCTAGAEAKCVRMGYGPWKALPDGRPMADTFHACIRLVRADYCGDGQASTQDGTVIDVYDAFGIQEPDTDAALPFEAAWSRDGAVCVARTRVPAIKTLVQVVQQCPRLAAMTPECTEAGMRSRGDVLLFNRSRAQ